MCEAPTRPVTSQHAKLDFLKGQGRFQRRNPYILRVFFSRAKEKELTGFHFIYYFILINKSLSPAEHTGLAVMGEQRSVRVGTAVGTQQWQSEV